jgi:hypothetical protein
MTHDAEVSTTLTGAFEDLRDKVGGMTGWSIALDNFTGYNNNENFVLQTATSEYVEFEPGGGNDELCRVSYGPDYDTTNDQWTDQYSTVWNFSPQANDDFRLSATDSVTYWLTYTSGTGFVFYMDRNEGDSYDGDGAFGMANLTKLWAYDTAANREGDYAILSQGGAFNGDHVFNDTGEGGTAQASVDAKGIVNPDGNFNDYVAIETNFPASNQYEGDISKEAIIGTHDLWLHDQSGSASAHKETIDDGAGNPKWVILDAHSFQDDNDSAQSIAIREDI